MKTPHLLALASFAVAATAAAADLKDPAEVAREWSQSVGPTVITDFSLKGQTRDGFRPKAPPPRLSFDYTESPSGFSFDRNLSPPRPRSLPKPQWGPIPRDKIYDAPNYSVPEVLPDNMPPGSKVWRYGGQDYYLIPLIPSREK